METLPEDGWEELLTQQYSASDVDENDHDENASDGDDDVMEVDKPVVEPKLLPLKDVNTLLESINHSVQCRYPSSHKQFADFLR